MIMSRKKYVKKPHIDSMIKYVSVLSIIWLFSLPTIINIAFSAVLSLFCILCLAKGWIYPIDRQENKRISIKIRIIISAVLAILGLCFFKKWSVPDSDIFVPDIILNCSDLIIGMITVILMTGSFPFLLNVASRYLLYHDSRSIAREDSAEQNKKVLFYLFLIAVITITLCSKSSIIYPFNDAADGNCFLTVGKSLLHGKVLYRDLVEQKGPYIYFLHSLAAVISENTFLAVFLLEIINAFLFLCIIYKTVCLFNKDIPVGIIALFAALIFSQGGFFHGDEIEEFCLPAIALTNYYVLRNVKKQIGIQPKEMLLVGIMAGTIFWSKYTICGYFACWYVIVAVHQVKEHRINSLVECFFAGLSGVVLSTIPVFLYFALNKSLYSLWEIYFAANLFNYNNVSPGIAAGLLSMAKNLASGVWISLRYNFANCIFILCGVFWLRTRKERFQYVALTAVTFLFTCIGMNPQKYYTFLLAAFSAPGILFIWSCYERTSKYKNISWLFSLVACAMISISLSPNIYMLGYSREELPQYRFADTIKESQNATLLNYGFLDCGYYTTSGIVPSCRYFCKLNANIPELTEVQDYYVNNGLTEFVVSRDKTLDSEYYRLCDSCTYYFENAYRTDYLYRLKH